MLLSVITITYQDPQGLQRTLRSLEPLLKAKDSMEWEHVVIDGSPEVSAPVLEAVSADWPLVHHCEPPKGVYAAMNLGVNKSRGDVLWFLNSGDLLGSLEQFFELMDQIKREPRVDLVCGAADLYRDSQYLYPRIPHPKYVRNLIGKNQLCHQAMLYRRRVFNQVGLFSTQFRLASDYEHHWRVFLAGCQVICLDRRWIHYDMGGISSNYRIALQEFSFIHRSIRSELPIRIRVWNRCCFVGEAMRLRLLSLIKRSFSGRFLRPLWLKWKRLKA